MRLEERGTFPWTSMGQEERRRHEVAGLRVMAEWELAPEERRRICSSSE